MRGDYQVEDWVMLCLTIPSGNVIKRPAHISAIEPYYDRGEIAFYYYTVGNIFQFGKQCERLLPNKGFKPIPLTPEILEKNGFKYSKWYGWQIKEPDFTLCFVGDTPHFLLDEIFVCDCPYVHTLQHALRLCGIEKEIVL